jgi:SAM-dependent methyltransferase
VPDFSKREMIPELMDHEAMEYPDFRNYLRQLAQVNRLFFGYRPTLAFFRRLLDAGRLSGSRPIRVVDAGSGYGDMLRVLDVWAAKKGIELEFIGLDINPWSAQAAREATNPGRPIQWLTADIFDFPRSERVDVVISSLFAHHLDDAALIRFLKWMEKTARIGWFVNDLARDPAPYYGFKAYATVTRRHHCMRHDGPASVANSFRPSDWTHYLAEAGIGQTDASIEKWMPYRLCVSRVKAA